MGRYNQGRRRRLGFPELVAIVVVGAVTCFGYFMLASSPSSQLIIDIDGERAIVKKSWLGLKTETLPVRKVGSTWMCRNKDGKWNELALDYGDDGPGE